MKYEKLHELIMHKKWNDAIKELEYWQATDWNDTLAILAATICFENNMWEEGYEYIRRGLIYNYRNYELYFMLGNYYESKNVNQAWLCYENALFFCTVEEDREMIEQYKKRLENNSEWGVRKTSIIVLSFNLKDICIQCIESIRRNNPPDSYELIVIDNASTDGIIDWLKEQKDIIFIQNSCNMGFPYGCNQGVEVANNNNNIFLLNNDTIVLPNSIFWLRMGLYDGKENGATGSVTNYAGNGQVIDQDFAFVEEYCAYAMTHNVPMRNALESKIWLVGFAMLIRREALEQVGLLDTLFSPGCLEDDDYGIRLQCSGWKVMLCWNSFIYHYGSGKGKNQLQWEGAQKGNIDKFIEKWGFNITHVTWPQNEMISFINSEMKETFRVLEIGCGCGATLMKLRFLNPNAQIFGIEKDEIMAKIASNNCVVICGDIKSIVLPYEKNYFDYILIRDVEKFLNNIEEILGKIEKYLKNEGMFIFSAKTMKCLNTIKKNRMLNIGNLLQTRSCNEQRYVFSVHKHK